MYLFYTQIKNHKIKKKNKFVNLPTYYHKKKNFFNFLFAAAIKLDKKQEIKIITTRLYNDYHIIQINLLLYILI